MLVEQPKIIDLLRSKIHKCNHFNHPRALRKFSRSMKSYCKSLSNEIERVRSIVSPLWRRIFFLERKNIEEERSKAFSLLRFVFHV